MCLSGFPALRSSHRHGDVSAGPTFCRSSRKVLQIKYHTPESCCWPQTAYCSLNVCLTLAFLKGFKKLPQTAHQHGEGRTGESSPLHQPFPVFIFVVFLSVQCCLCVSLCRLILCWGCWVLEEGWTLIQTRRTGDTEMWLLLLSTCCIILPLTSPCNLYVM